MPTLKSGYPKGKPPTPRKAKTNKEFRATVQKLLEDNAENVHKWLAQVANGTLRVYEGQLIGDPPNPGKALDLLSKLAEYAAPKLSRAEVVPEGQLQGTHIQIEFIRPAPRLETVAADIVEMPRVNGHAIDARNGSTASTEPDES